MSRWPLTNSHDRPPSSDLWSPPRSASTFAHTRFGSAPDTVTVILPSTPSGRPGLRVMSVQVSPPSVDLKIPGPLASAPQAPRPAVHLPERRVENVGVARIHDEIDSARVLVAEEDLGPGPAPVGGPEDSALRVGPEGVAERRDVRAVRIRGMNPDASDCVGFGEAQVPPAPAGVVGTVDAVALEDIGAQLHFAGADVDDVGVGRRHRDRADRGAPDLPVGHRAPCVAAVGRLEEPAAGRAEVVLVRPLGVARDGDRASATVGADRTPFHGREQGDEVLGGERRRYGGQGR